MDSLPDHVRRLADKCSQRALAALVSRRNDLDDRNDLSVPVLDHDSIGPMCINVALARHDESSLWRRRRNGHATGRFALSAALGPPIQSKYVGNWSARLLIGKGDIAGRQSSSVERSA